MLASSVEPPLNRVLEFLYESSVTHKSCGELRGGEDRGGGWGGRGGYRRGRGGGDVGILVQPTNQDIYVPAVPAVSMWGA